MQRLFLVIAAGLLSFAGAVSASSFIATTDTIGSSIANTSKSTSDTTSKIGDDKVILAAKNDAASFVGSAGELRGVNLEAALSHIRQQLPTLEATDMQLAEAILAL